ncbi:MAG: sigma-54-dependent Fis family transcriptional regulator [Candidatus Latescibacterota bacterium]|nr:MAG: sigma-54-dependent Fis family transcriptional regulator [Candidatus Latescibacterota bacterium]RKY71582.1 MAG: sigma-54-dependent Fis family transcriptional regulator [Candidatus Latescibacterota bacterium]
MLKTGLQVLVVDDEWKITDLLEDYISSLGYRVTATTNSKEALKLAQQSKFDIVITDLKMPEPDGLQLLSAIKQIHPSTEVVILTAFGSMESAIEALKLDASDYLLKPINLELLKISLERIAKKRALEEENISLRKRVREGCRIGELTGISSQILEIQQIIRRAAQSDSTVLISGESGTGKELVARTIHETSARRDGPFVPVNCGAIVETLLESELFGHVKGAFSGATRDNIGLFRTADGGTIFLDEITEISPSLQVKLLRVLEEGRIRPVGASKQIPIDVRVIAASNRSIDEALKDGSFRKDLYYRLNVIPINVPPLRERKEDIPILAEQFLEILNSQSKRQVKEISVKAMEALLSYNWPGNVRELRNVIERSFVLGTGESITLGDLPPELRAHEVKTPDTIPTLVESERSLIRRVLQKSRNKTEAAKLLGIDRTTLYRKIKKHGLAIS